MLHSPTLSFNLLSATFALLTIEVSSVFPYLLNLLLILLDSTLTPIAYLTPFIIRTYIILDVID